MAKITQIEIEIGKKKIKLSYKQAKGLKAALDDLFQEKTWYYPTYPQWSYTTSTGEMPDTAPIITYSDTTAQISIN